MPSELSESFLNPFQPTGNAWFNAKKEMEQPPPPSEPPPQEPVPEPEVVPPPSEPVTTCSDGVCKVSFVNKMKSKFGSSSSKKGFMFIVLIIILLICYFLFKKINLNGIPNEL